MATKPIPLLTGVTVQGAGAQAYNQPSQKTFNALLTGTGAVSASINIEACNVDNGWVTIGTIPLSGTGSAADGFYHDGPWAQIRANVTAISGTNAAVSVSMCVPA